MIVSCGFSVTSDSESNNADILLDSGFKLSDIIINLCSKLQHEVILKLGNYIEFDSGFWTLIVRLCNSD